MAVSITGGDRERHAGGVWNQIGSQAGNVSFNGSLYRFRSQHNVDISFAAQCLLEQVEALGDAPTLVGQATARDGPPHIFQ